jgi:transposase
MRAGSFWLNDKQWACIAPHLPTNLTGPERDDDRRIISGIIHMLQCGAAGAIARPSMVPTRPSIIASIAGPNEDAEERSSRAWSIAVGTA